MRTIKNILRDAKEILRKADIISYQIDAEILLMHLLNISKTELICNLNRKVKQSDYNSYQLLLEQRLAYKPISQIIGLREFYGREFIVSNKVLDPRPDSETLIDVSRKFYNKSSNIKILDLGCGSGVLGLTLLAELPNSKAIAVDISRDALNIARRNAKYLNLEKLCQFVQSNWYENITGKFDLIISNPPYIPSSDIPNLQKEIFLHEPHNALDGGDDGLDCYREIACKSSNFLNENGKIILEIGIGQENDIKNIFQEYGFYLEYSEKDLGQIIRCLVFIKPSTL